MSYFKNINFWLVIALGCLIVLGLTWNAEPAFYFMLAILGIIILLFLMKHLDWGIYLIALIYPFNYWDFSYGSINVPYVDLLAMILFLAWVINTIYLNLKQKQKITFKMFPALPLMIIFAASAFISLLNVDREGFFDSLKYVFRPIIFFYLMYVILPYNIIDNLKKYYRTLKAMFVLGLGVSLMGIWAIIFPPLVGVRRALPIAIFGIYPLGTNHNLLAEVFIGLIPFAFILFWQEKDVFMKNIYLLGALIMAGVNLLTLSRAGWLALALEGLIFLILNFQYWSKIKKSLFSYGLYLILLVLLPVIYLMYNLSTSIVALSSNLSRLKLIEISLNLFRAHPWIGNGAGTFYNEVAQIKWYTIQYGSAIDSHGVIFKLLAEMGLLGLFSFCLLIGYIIYRLYKNYILVRKSNLNWIALGSLLAVIGGLTFQLFGTDYYIANLWFPIGMAMVSLKFGLKENFTAKK